MTPRIPPSSVGRTTKDSLVSEGLIKNRLVGDGSIGRDGSGGPRSTRSGWLVAALLLAAFAGCSPDPGPIREWTPKDHDREDPVKNQGGQVRQTKQADDEPDLVELAWEKNCVRCHGRFGQGDGPMGPANQAPDLTRPDFLSSHTNEEIEATIRNGRNKMPAFGTLPDRVIAGLVKRIRSQGRPD